MCSSSPRPVQVLDIIAKKKPEEKPRALIVVPTRELAVQIEDDAELLHEGMPEVKIGSFYGGVGYNKQERKLEEGADIIIGTPGRLIDFSRSGKIDFKTFSIVIIDEADRLFDMGFYPDIQHMLKLMRPREERQTMLFSATLSTRVRHLAWEHMNEPREIEIEPEHVTVEEIRQELYHVSKNEKFELLLYLLAKHNLENAIIFTNTKVRAVEVAKRLELNGYHVQFLMGDLPQRKRLQVIERMKSGENKFLVATDVAARGLHVDDLQLVVNYDVPEDFENYVHRIGRTARAGKSGLAVTLACEDFVYGLEAIQDFIGMKIPVMWLEEGALDSVEDKSAGIHFRTLIKGTEVDRDYRSSDRGSGRGRSEYRRQSPSRSGGSRPRSAGTAQSRPVSDSPQKVKTAPPQRSRSTPPQAKPKKPAVRTDRPKASPSSARPISGPAKPASSQTKPAAPRQTREPDYAALSAMPLEERLAYYKKNLSGRAGAERKPEQSSKTGRQQEQRTRPRPAPSPRTEAQQKDGSAVQPQEEKPAEKKKGFLKRLLHRD